LTPANIQEEFRGNPPGLILPTFFAGSATPPIFSQGTSDKPPWGFTFPALGGSALCPTVPCLDSKGGIPGAELGIGGIDPNIVSPTAFNYSAAMEHRLGGHFVATVLYSGSHDTNLVGNGNASGQVSYGVDINATAGALIGLPPNSPPPRPNNSFGTIFYTRNDRVSNYSAITFDLRGRSKRGFFDVSYTRSSSKDDAGQYPTALNPHQYYGPSPWDVPNRFSASFNYELPGMNGGQGFVGRLTGGWGIGGTSIYQSGYPFTAELTTKQIRRGVHRSVTELERAIGAFLDAHNADPKLFAWTKSADEILASIARFAQGTADTQATQFMSRYVTNHCYRTLEAVAKRLRRPLNSATYAGGKGVLQPVQEKNAELTMKREECGFQGMVIRDSERS
jgi:hypothetical protein